MDAVRIRTYLYRSCGDVLSVGWFDAVCMMHFTVLVVVVGDAAKVHPVTTTRGSLPAYAAADDGRTNGRTMVERMGFACE